MKLALAEILRAGTLNVLAAKSMPGTQNVLPFINVADKALLPYPHEEATQHDNAKRIYNYWHSRMKSCQGPLRILGTKVS